MTGIVPNAGPSAGGTTATITGISFGADATVTFGGTAATGVVVQRATSITATVPAHTAGMVDVVVTNADAQSGTATNGFTYLVPTIAVTTAAAGITSSGATLNGTANPNGTATNGSFEYGLTTSYGSPTAAQNLGAGNVSLSIGDGNITGLTCNTLYHFRAVATNLGGTTNGLDGTFTTSACPPVTATVAASPGTVAAGAVVTVTWQGIVAPSVTDWVALIRMGAPDTSWVAWQYTTGTGGGSMDVTLPGAVLAGTYELRLFAHDSLQRLALSNSINVTATAITANPATALPGETVTATWTSVGEPSGSDWIAVVPAGASDASYLRWEYTTGTESGSRGLALPASIPPGNYELRLFAQDSLRRLAVSNTITVPAVTVSAGPATIAPGGTLTVSWQSIGTPTPLDWLALVPLGGADGSYVAWILGTGRSSDSTLFLLPPAVTAGSYEVRMFGNNTFKRLGTSNGITVTAPGPSLAASPAVTAPGGTLTVNWKNIATPTATDWVGVFAVGAADSSDVTRFYTGGRVSDRTLKALAADLPVGSYELRLFAHDTLTRLATSNGVTVATGPSLTVSPAAVAAGGTLAVTWTGIATPTATDWVGLVPLNAADNLYVVFSFTTGAASGSLGLAIPASVPAGTYELRLFAHNTFQRLAASNLVTVGPTLVMSPTAVAAGGTVTVTWAGITTPTPTDWLAVVPANAPDTSYVAWVYTNSRAGDSMPFVLPAALPAGQYDLRLFAHDTFVRLALSNVVAVTAAGPILVTSPVIAAGGTTLTVNWQGIAAPTANNWIGVYPAGATDASSLTQTFTNGQSSGSTSIALATGVTAGAYELRLFANNTLTRLAVSNGVTVVAGAVVRITPASAAANSTVTVNWEGIITPTATDWVALVPLNGPDGSFVAWAFTTGAASGSGSLFLPASVPAGTYELRLFAHNTFTRLTVSNVVTIVP